MRHRVLSLDLFGDRLEVEQRTKDEHDPERERMLKTLRSVMDGELTERQKECIRLCFFEGKSMKETAELLGVTPPTVSKHVKKACERIGRVMGYSFPRLRRTPPVLGNQKKE